LTKTNKSTYAVIMAGGGGTRLWPLSRARTPKQILSFKGERSLFQLTVDRLLPIIPIENILVVTVSEQKQLMHDQVPDLLEENFILEPAPKGTASVVGLAAVILNKKDPASIMCCLPADHYIENSQEFRGLIQSAASIASEDDLITLGIQPGYASTGYGYIHVGERKHLVNDFQLYRVNKFREKPDRKTAEAFVRSGEYYWNSGMFIWKTDRILEEFQLHMPELSAGLEEIRESIGRQDEESILEEVWLSLSPETIDYGVMEKADRVSVLVAEDLGWFDIGSWDGLFDLLDQDDQGNVLIGDGLILEGAKNSLVLNRSSRNDSLIALIGISDLIVVRTDDVLLVCQRGSSEQVRKIVKDLSKSGNIDYL
jgi:mannose-1-phosphate guanylyltransferase